MSQPSRLPISHPYPPSYRSSGSSPSPPDGSPSITYGYQRNRNERLQPNPEHTSRYGVESSPTTNTIQSTPAYPAKPGFSPACPSNPPYSSSPNERNHQPVPPYPSSAESIPSYPTKPSNPNPFFLTRERSTSSSSLQPVLGKGEDYPEGWSKADEEAEKEFMAQGLIDWGSMKSWRFWIRAEWWGKLVVDLPG